MLTDHVHNIVENYSGLLLASGCTITLCSRSQKVVEQKHGRDHSGLAVLSADERESLSESSEASVLIYPSVDVSEHEHLPRLKMKRFSCPHILVLLEHLGEIDEKLSLVYIESIWIVRILRFLEVILKSFHGKFDPLADTTRIVFHPIDILPESLHINLLLLYSEAEASEIRSSSLEE